MGFPTTKRRKWSRLTASCRAASALRAKPLACRIASPSLSAPSGADPLAAERSRPSPAPHTLFYTASRSPPVPHVSYVPHVASTHRGRAGAGACARLRRCFATFPLRTLRFLLRISRPYQNASRQRLAAGRRGKLKHVEGGAQLSTELPRGDWRTRALCGNRCDFGCHGNRRVLCARAKIMSGGSPANAGRASRSRAALSTRCLNLAPPPRPKRFVSIREDSWLKICVHFHG